MRKRTMKQAGEKTHGQLSPRLVEIDQTLMQSRVLTIGGRSDSACVLDLLLNSICMLGKVCITFLSVIMAVCSHHPASGYTTYWNDLNLY